MNEIRVYVIKFGNRPHYQMQYLDPLSGKKKTKTTKTASIKDARKIAAKWEADLQAGRYMAPSKITWAEFRTRYEDQVLSGLAANTDRKVTSVFNAVEKHLSPHLLRDVTAERISFLQSKLREGGRSENTIAGHMAHLRASLVWAANVAMIPTVPKVAKPKRARKSSVMKGRPITLEEFERMLVKIDVVVNDLEAIAKLAADPEKLKRSTEARAEADTRTASWKYYLEGLWHSGLRLAESLELYWDRPDRLCVDTSGKHPMLRIPAGLEKGNRDRLLPMAPEFARFLLQTPEAKRRGRVFDPQPQRVKGPRLLPHRVGEIVAKIGEKAGVKVSDDGNGKVKHATAHDLRRSFGERWASRVMPQVLMVLMRHESIDTTMRFYVGRNAQTTADVLWKAEAAVANDLANTRQLNDQKAAEAASVSQSE